MTTDWAQLLNRAWNMHGSRKEKGQAGVRTYVENLLSWGAVHNLTAVSSEEEIYTNLITPSLIVSAHLAHYDCVMDLGTGAGIPGMVAAIVRPEQQWVLVEKSQKKTAFLKRIVHHLSLGNVEIVNGDFLRIPVDSGVSAIVTRGSAKLHRQLEMTRLWRIKGIPLFSIQSQKSLQASGVTEGYVQQELDDCFTKLGLVLIKVK